MMRTYIFSPNSTLNCSLLKFFLRLALSVFRGYAHLNRVPLSSKPLYNPLILGAFTPAAELIYPVSPRWEPRPDTEHACSIFPFFRGLRPIPSAQRPGANANVAKASRTKVLPETSISYGIGRCARCISRFNSLTGRIRHCPSARLHYAIGRKLTSRTKNPKVTSLPRAVGESRPGP